MSKKKTSGQMKRKSTLRIVLYSALALFIILLILFYPKKISNLSQRSTQQSKRLETVKLARGELYFLGADGQKKAGLLIEIAEDDYSRSKGLMQRRDLAENQGMLFIFDREEPRVFWMKNTPLSLDMIFINARKEIIRIHKYTTPFSTQTYPSGQPAQFVVETVAGFTDRYEIKIGDCIEWRRDKNATDQKNEGTEEQRSKGKK